MATPEQIAFLNGVQAQIRQTLGSKINGRFDAMLYPSGFNYGITYGNNNYFNLKTLADIDTLVGTGPDGSHDLTGGSFSSYYCQVLDNIDFVFSQADQEAKQSGDNAASAQINSIVKAYTNSGRDIPGDTKDQLSYIFAALRKEFNTPDLTKLPEEVNEIRNAIMAYKQLARTSYVLNNRWAEAVNRLEAAKDHIRHPSADNGGLRVGDKAYAVAYTKIPTANQLTGGLKTTSNAITVKVEMSNLNAESSDLSVSGSGPIRVALGNIIGFNIGGSSSSYNMSRYASSGANISMDLTYTGITMFDAYPLEVTADNVKGWYLNDILDEARIKTGDDNATGYKLTGGEFSVERLFGDGKKLARVKTFVISQQPTISIVISGGDAKQIRTDFDQRSSVCVRIFGFSVGCGNRSYHVRNVEENQKSNSVRLTMGPPDISGTTTLDDQVAFMLGGVAAFPPEIV